MNTIRYAKLSPDAKSPFRKNKTDAGMDFYSLNDVILEPHSMTILHTGITVEIPEGQMLLMKPKSRNEHLVGAGVIDCFYEPGEILVKVVNIKPYRVEIKKGDGIAQGVLVHISTPSLTEVDVEELKNNSTRSGQGGIVNQANSN